MTEDTGSSIACGPSFYDPSLTSRKYALVGVACSSIFSIICIITGTLIIATRGEGVDGTFRFELPSPPLWKKEILSLVLTLTVALCTESTGFVHSISLRSALASESRLRFNTNLRLLTAAHGWRNPNGTMLNGFMAVLLILSYTSASLVLLSPTLDEDNGTLDEKNGTVDDVDIIGLPLLLLGVVLLLQAVIALSGMWAVKIWTWSPSCLDVTAALIHNELLTPDPSQSMCDVGTYGGSARPSNTQPSAWHSHDSIRKVILSIWGLLLASTAWATVAILIWNFVIAHNSGHVESWSFFPDDSSKSVSWRYSLTIQGWILSYASLALVQGPLTLGLHCAELVANVIQDERRWRYASGRKGLRMTTNPLKSFFTNPLGLVLFVAKFALHWMFGISYNINSDDSSGKLSRLRMEMYTAQIWNLCIALSIFSCCFTLVALFRPRGPQPAVYGHLQTLANLVDEWTSVVGHKKDRNCHVVDK